MIDRDSANHYDDKLLQCVDCGHDFVWTAGEQAFYNSKRPPLAPPKRCKACREWRRRTIHPPSDLDARIARVTKLFGNQTDQGVR